MNESFRNIKESCASVSPEPYYSLAYSWEKLVEKVSKGFRRNVSDLFFTWETGGVVAEHETNIPFKSSFAMDTVLSSTFQLNKSQMTEWKSARGIHLVTAVLNPLAST